MKKATKEEIQTQLDNLIKNNPPMSRINSDEDNMNSVEMGVSSFDIFGSKLFVLLLSDQVEYVKEYIDTIVAGSPDKESVVRRYARDNQELEESFIDRMIKNNPYILVGSNSPIRIVSTLNAIDRDLEPILNALKRDKKIDDILL